MSNYLTDHHFHGSLEQWEARRLELERGLTTSYLRHFEDMLLRIADVFQHYPQVHCVRFEMIKAAGPEPVFRCLDELGYDVSCNDELDAEIRAIGLGWATDPHPASALFLECNSGLGFGRGRFPDAARAACMAVGKRLPIALSTADLETWAGSFVRYVHAQMLDHALPKAGIKKPSGRM